MGIRKAVRAFRTFTADLHQLADWLVQCGVKTVAMESDRGLLDSNLPGSARAGDQKAYS
jgi:hypothetical protein